MAEALATLERRPKKAREAAKEAEEAAAAAKKARGKAEELNQKLISKHQLFGKTR